MNRQGLSYKLAVNQFADLTFDEMRSMRGRRNSDTEIKKPSKEQLLFDKRQNINVSLPKRWDWRTRGAVTPVKVFLIFTLKISKV